jgi:HEPN domain-containing protein
MDEDILDVKKWIRYAQEDYDLTDTITKANHPYSARHVCYLCQQSAEKVFKAYMIAKEGTRIKEHDLNILRKKCERYSPDFDVLKFSCSVLNEHITKSRYPSNSELTEVDMKEALKCAGEILEFTKSKLAEMGFGA